MDRQIISTRLSRLREALRRLKEIASTPLEEYMSSNIQRPLAEHFLCLALESVLDLGNHVIAAKGVRKPLQLRDIPLILAENAVIAPDLAERIARATGLRNRLVYGYSDIA
jgi:uncharacterized protein YutE (UPF0331/DUF86 family)